MQIIWRVVIVLSLRVGLELMLVSGKPLAPHSLFSALSEKVIDPFLLHSYVGSSTK